MQSVESLLDLSALSESCEVECKLAAGKPGSGGTLPGDLWESYSAFANTCGGEIFLGIRERRGKFTVNGIEQPERLVKSLWDLLNNPQKASCNLLEEQDVQILSIDDKQVIRIVVPQAQRKQRPVFVGGNPMTGTYKRRHEADQLCSQEEVRRMMAEQVEDNRDDTILDGLGLADIDLESLNAFRQRLRARQSNHPFLDRDDQEFLRCIGGWRRDRKSGEQGLTIAGLLMFGQGHVINEELPNYLVDYRDQPDPESDQRWQDRLIPDGTWSGNLFDFFRRVYSKLVTDLPVPFQLDQDGQRLGETEVHEAIREGLVNALVHADYTGRASIRIEKSAGHFSFRNPGLMRIPIEHALEGGESDCRNRNLHKMFLLIGMGDRAGSGIPKIYSRWRNRHWQAPKLYEKDEPYEQTLLELYMTSLVSPEITSKLQAQFGAAFEQLSELERTILITADIESNITHQRIRQLSTRHSRDITLALGRLERGGLLSSTGSFRNKIYHLPDAEITTSAQVFNPQSSEHTALNSEYNAANSEHYAADSAHSESNSEQYPEQRDAQGRFISSKLDHPFIDDVYQLSDACREALFEIAREPRDKKRLPSEQVRAVICQVCAEHYVSLSALAKIVNRSPDGLRQQHLKPMVSDGLLKMAFPQPNDPKQGYIALPAEAEQTSSDS